MECRLDLAFIVLAASGARHRARPSPVALGAWPRLLLTPGSSAEFLGVVAVDRRLPLWLRYRPARSRARRPDILTRGALGAEGEHRLGTRFRVPSRAPAETSICF
jgi:hypothetical protein